MPSARRHRAQSRRNLRLFREVLDPSPRWRDWSVVALFYSVLHDVQAMLEERGERPSRGSLWTHESRNDVLRNHYGRLWKPYHRLYDLSQDVRYEGKVPSAQEVRDHEQKTLPNILAEIQRARSR